MAGNDTAALVVALSAQLTKFEKDMSDAGRIADVGVRKIENRFAKLNPGAGLEELTNKLNAIATAGGIFELLKTMQDLIAEVAKIGDQAERVGLTAQQFQALRFAAISTGASVETAGSFMDRFSRTISDAARGSGELYQVFLQNNVALKDANGNLLPTTVLLGKFADLVKNAKSAQDQMNLSILAGGRQAGPEFLNILREGSEGLRQFAEEAEKSGAIASDTLIARAKEIEKRYNILWQQLKLGAQEFAVDAATAVKTAFDQDKNDIERVGSGIKSIWDSIVKYIEENSPNGKNLLNNVKQLLEEEQHRIVPAPGRISDSAIASGLPAGTDPRTLPAPASSNKTTVVPDVQATDFKKLLELHEERIRLLGAEQQAIGLTVGEATQLKTQIELETQARQKNIPLTEERKQAIADEAAKTGQAAQALDDYKRRFAGLNSAVQFVGEGVIDVMDGLRNKTLSAADAVKQLANSFIHAAEQALLLGSGPLAGLFGTQTNVPGGTGGLFGLLAKTPGFASGTDFAPGGLAMVGENGAEMVNLPRGSQVVSRNDIGGQTIHVTNIIDASNADPGVEARIMQRLPVVVDIATRNAVKAVQQGRRNNPGFFG